MAKSYEELTEYGWIASSTPGLYYHPHTGIAFERLKAESDAEFRERLERNTPGLENFDWVTALRRAKNRRRRLQFELQKLEQEIEPLTQKVREHSLWNVAAGLPFMTWDEMQQWATNHLEIKEVKIAKHDYRVEFFGLKSQGRPLLAIATRVGWPQDMEGDDE